MNFSVELINEIDKRINNALAGKDILCRTSAKVIGVDPAAARAEVIFYGDPKEIIHTFPYRQNGLILQPGDCVFVESKLYNLTTGIITDKLFGMEE